MDPTQPPIASEDLLEALGGVAREEDDTSQAWEAAVAGTRGGDEVRRERESIDGPELSQAYAELFQPVTPDERERLTDLLAATLSQPRAADSPGDPGEKPPVSLGEHRRRRGRWIAGAATLAAAAGLILWLSPASPTAVGVQLPPYSLTVRNRTIATSRAGDSGEGPARYRPDSEIEWVLSPEVKHSTAVGVGFIALANTGVGSAPMFGRITKMQLQASGAVAIRGTVDEVLGLPSGRWRVHLLVADPQHLPATAQAARALLDTAPEDVQVTRPAYVIEIEPVRER